MTNTERRDRTSNDVTVTWETASCGPDVPLPPSDERILLYTGGTRVQYSDPIELAGLLSDPTGRAGRRADAPVRVRRPDIRCGDRCHRHRARRGRPRPWPPQSSRSTVNFDGGSDLPALRATQTVTVEREDVLFEYTAKTLLGTAVPQPVSARFRDPDSLTPIPARPSRSAWAR